MRGGREHVGRREKMATRGGWRLAATRNETHTHTHTYQPTHPQHGRPPDLAPETPFSRRFKKLFNARKKIKVTAGPTRISCNAGTEPVAMRRHTLILSVLGLGLVGAAVTPVEICPDTTAENSGTVCACSPASPGPRDG